MRFKSPSCPSLILPQVSDPSSLSLWHDSLLPLPFPSIPDITLDLWKYRVVRSLCSNWSLGCLLHLPFFRPYHFTSDSTTSPPLLEGASHYFEWRHPDSLYPLAIFVIDINPAFQFDYPLSHITHHLTFGGPAFHILHWDCPVVLPYQITDKFDQLHQEPQTLIT